MSILAALASDAEQVAIHAYISASAAIVSTLHPSATIQGKVEQLILGRNNAYPPLVVTPTFGNPAKGTLLHRIDTLAAAQIAMLVMEADKHGLSIPYILACLCIESLFDPHCENGNFLGSNPEKAPDGYDIGIAQVKLKYLPFDIATAREKALDPAWAIPYFIGLMSSLVVSAESIVAAAPSGPFKSIPYVATGCYNFGVAGMRKIVASGVPPSHCEVVKTLETTFAGLVGIPSCM